jgi:glycogen debranching enzyme
MKSVVDLKNIPFSRFGSYFVISDMKDKLYIRDVRRGDLEPGIIFEMIIPGEKTDYQILGDETELILDFDSGNVHLIMPDLNTLRIKTIGMTLQLVMPPSKYDNHYRNPSGYHEICSYAHERRFGIHNHVGEFDVSTDKNCITIAIEPNSDIVLEGYKVSSSYNSMEPYEVVLDSVKKHFDSWVAQLAKKDNHVSRLAAYITWSNMVHDEGQLKRYAMYMSMNWMTNIWSWDNCFGAIALAKENPELAYDQYIFFKELQDASGMLPDYANTVYASYASAKPPIYGWAYRYMMQRNDAFKDVDRLKEVYDFVESFTKFWLEERTHNGMPYYTHGNESGWDNGTNYEEGVPIASPDLLAFLIDQIDFLIEVGQKLSINIDNWKIKVEKLLDQLMTLWHGNQFRPYLINEGRFVTTGDSLQNYVPILIADRLKPSIKNQLIKGLLEDNRFLTKYGLATESVSSDFYAYNGYWKGPIWAPTMLIFIDAVKNSGNQEEAQDLAERFIKCMEIGGMAENFDPLTAEGLVDPSFAWTSSVYLTLTDEFSK